MFNNCNLNKPLYNSIYKTISGLSNDDLDTILVNKLPKFDDNLYVIMTNNLYNSLDQLTTDLKRSTDNVIYDR